ncbi:MAG: pentapeptide repeat-containing protein [Thaumarchaeota archaeon]|nr:pentapeptide repeat-containing protein [Nitrososphaerota archaeon]
MKGVKRKLGIISLLCLPLLLILPIPVNASSSVVTGGGTFVNNQSITFNVIAAYNGYTFYSRTATGELAGTLSGTQNVQAFGVILPSGAIVEQGTITCTPCSIDGKTGTITSPFNVFAPNGVNLVGEELNSVGSGGLAGLRETSVYQGAINPSGPSSGTYQIVYEFGATAAAPPVEAPLAQSSGLFAVTDIQIGSPVNIGGYTFITYTSNSVESGDTIGTASGPQLFVIYPDGNTFAFAGTTTLTGTIGDSRTGTDLTSYVGQGDLATGTYTANWGVSSGTGGLAGIQGTTSFMGTHAVAATYSGWNLLPGAVGPGVNLQHGNLQGLVLQDDNLAGDNLQHASLANDNLGGLNFAGANMQHADLSGATLTGTASQNTNFDGANMQHANLEDTVCGRPNYISAAGTNTQQIDLTGSSGCSPPL